MMDQKTKERIGAQETARFMDSQFGQLDLSGSPDLTHPLAETFELQDVHGFNRVDGAMLAGINQLKELLSNPPREAMEELAKETNNPELISELAHERVKATPEELEEIIDHGKQFKLTDGERNQLCCDLAIAMSQRARQVNGRREDPNSRFIHDLGYALTAVGQLPERAWFRVNYRPKRKA
jgi:hypothetical protein